MLALPEEEDVLYPQVLGLNHMATLCKVVINSGVSVTHPGPQAMSVSGKRRRLCPGGIDIWMGLEGRGDAARWHRGKDL